MKMGSLPKWVRDRCVDKLGQNNDRPTLLYALSALTSCTSTLVEPSSTGLGKCPIYPVVSNITNSSSIGC